MKKYTLILFPFLCFLNFYLFADDEGIYLNFPSNASVIQVDAAERIYSTSDGSISQNYIINSQTRILQDFSESVTKLSKEVEVTILDYQESERPADRGFGEFGGFDEGVTGVPIKILIEEDGSIRFSEKNKEEVMDSENLFYFIHSSSLPITSALADKQLVQGQVIETYFGDIPLKMTITEITQDSVYVDIETLLVGPMEMEVTEITQEDSLYKEICVELDNFSDEDEYFDDDDDEDEYFDEEGYHFEILHDERCDSSYLRGKGVWKRDNALIHDIKLEVQYVSGEHFYNVRTRSVSKQN